MISGEKGKIYGVSELTLELKRVLEGNFHGITVRGEINEYTPHRDSRHVYMSIKDARAQLAVVFFNGVQICQGYSLGIGSEVEIEGRLTIYEPQGRYQLVATAIRPLGMGGLRLQFEQMKEKLRAMGLFDMERKKPVPKFPKCIGVVTSRDGAALKDFLNVLGRRHSGVHVRIFPVVVQGKEAAASIVNAIRYINAYRLCDVIVVTRGGGSLEDLWPFNEEQLALAVAESELPVISAVGHERDYSICDFVADYRCATPSVAAEQVIEAKERLMEYVSNAHRRLQHALAFRLADAKRRLEVATASQFLKHPEDILNVKRQRLDILRQRLAGVLPYRAQTGRQRLNLLMQRLTAILPRLAEFRRQRFSNALARFMRQAEQPLVRFQERLERSRKVLVALGPNNVLSRGYSILLKSNGQAVRSPADVANGECLRGLLGQGEIKLKADEVKHGE